MSKLITIEDWDKIKGKIQRKYNSLTDDDLNFDTEENRLIQRIAELIHQPRSYVEFMISKMKKNINNNRL